MPHFHPPDPPHFLSEKMRDAERVVWQTLQKLDYSWHVFYSARENSGSGYDREVDFVLIRLNRIFYCEVKGGIVHVDQRAGPGVTWAHFTRAGDIVRKRADPKQLWAAKAALGETIRQIAGKSPRDLGFREHNFYIFPHTPRDVTRGADLERDYFHYAFAEDIAALPMRLQKIVESGKGRFIDHDRIVSIINSLDTLVLREREGMLPQAVGASRPAMRPVPARFSPDPIQSNQNTGLPTSTKKRLLQWWKPVTVGFGALILLGYFALWPIASPIWQRASVNPSDMSENRSGATTGPLTEANVPPPPSPVPVPKPSVGEIQKALPTFVPATAINDVERALAAAQDQAIYISWRSGEQHGLVILLATEENGCRRYQISRHDIQPTKFDMVRRCPSDRQ